MTKFLKQIKYEDSLFDCLETTIRFLQNDPKYEVFQFKNFNSPLFDY